MAQFLGDIAGMLEIFAIAGGLVLLHLAAKDPTARWLRAAGVVLVVGGVAVGACTSWFWYRYLSAGEFDHAAPMAMPMHGGMEEGAMPGMQGMPMHRQPGTGGR